MNFLQKKQFVSANMRKCVFGTRWSKGCNFSPGNSDEHEDAKWELYKYARRKKWMVGTEVEFVQGGRADLYLPEFDLAVEVVYSESLGSIKEKEGVYPVEEIRVFDAKVKDGFVERVEELFFGLE